MSHMGDDGQPGRSSWSTKPSDIGARTEDAVASALVRADREVSVPVFAAHGRTDLVYDDGIRSARVQCKTRRLLGDVVNFATCSNR